MQVLAALALKPYLERLGALPGALLGIVGTAAIAIAIYAVVVLRREERKALLTSVRAAVSRSS
jgi:hypothetical protein